MMYHVGAQTVENFFVVADAWAQVLSLFIRPNSHVMDIGCGCGRTARLLVLNQNVYRYTGFDIIAPYIEWCKQFFSELYSERFRFYHLNIRSDHYNPTGKLTCQTARFPADDGDIDLVFAASVFTHLLLDDARAYMREIRRVLKDGGKAVISFHEQPQPGHDFSGTEFRADYESDYFLQMTKEGGFDIFEDIGELCDHRSLVLQKK
jgi:SAM-dependent methyltransferase